MQLHVLVSFFFACLSAVQAAPIELPAGSNGVPLNAIPNVARSLLQGPNSNNAMPFKADPNKRGLLDSGVGGAAGRIIDLKASKIWRFAAQRHILGWQPKLRRDWALLISGLMATVRLGGRDVGFTSDSGKKSPTNLRHQHAFIEFGMRIFTIRKSSTYIASADNSIEQPRYP
ncbi:hypothetical protein BKA70DRAFT_1408409 [Coprinopsis sp. MPI-PUGE-AT-0042]|nr:hypothetical protein BKA70DRAFT_1408409 [Coprinopsis sp. MPI-PUGE-AT-0042]